MSEKYISLAKRNAVIKKTMEIRTLYNNSQPLPIFLNDKEAHVFYSPFDSNLETDELVEEWVRKLKLDGLSEETMMMETTCHDIFVTLFALNNLRRLGIPNFLYYYGGVNVDTKFYSLTEYTFNTEYKNWSTLTDICKYQSYENILSHYLSILLAIYYANHVNEYSHYNLTSDDILMKPIDESDSQTEYNFRKVKVYINNHGFIPMITNHDKSYIRLNVDDSLTSFGYNDTSEIPFENKGIYSDTGFPITDAYRLLISILKVTYDHNPNVYKKLLKVYEYFDEDEPVNKFIHLYKRTENMRLGDFIAYILINNKSVYSETPDNSLVRCIGVNLEVKNKDSKYYIAKNMIQLHDMINFYKMIHEKSEEIIKREINLFVENNLKESVKKEMSRFEIYKNEINSHTIIYKVPDKINIMYNDKYLDLLCKNMRSMEIYLHTWKRVELGIKILENIKHIDESYVNILNDYIHLLENNKTYKEEIIRSFKDIKNMTSLDKYLYNKLISKNLFLN